MSWSMAWTYIDRGAWSMLLGVVKLDSAITVYLFYFSVRVEW